jgi:DNA polymerase elongation subunit (family B)
MNFDWKYIYNRCKKIGIDITTASPSRKVQGNDNILMHVGIIDYLDIYRRWDRTVAIKESNSLDFVASAVLGTTKLKYNGTLQELYENDYDKYVLYNAVDARSEIKSMVMTILGETIDKIILGERPDYVNEEWLIDRLDKVKIT